MITIPGNVRVWLATGHTDMRRGFPSLAQLVQEGLKRDPHIGDLYVFRGRRGDLIKIIWHDGQGACLFREFGRALPKDPRNTGLDDGIAHFRLENEPLIVPDQVGLYLVPGSLGKSLHIVRSLAFQGPTAHSLSSDQDRPHAKYQSA